MKKGFLAIAVVLTMAWATPSFAADVILFDPDGSGANFGSISVDTFEWLPGNTLLVEHVPFDDNDTPLDLSDDTPGEATVYYQANLNSLELANSQAFDPQSATTGCASAPAGTECFFHGVAGVDVLFTQSPTSATFFLDPGGSTNFFKIYADDGDADDLAPFTDWASGVCFVCGTEILTATANSFFASVLPVPGGGVGNDLDQTSDGDQYPNVDTLKFTGGFLVDTDVTFADSNYFINLLDALTIATASTNGDLSAEYDSANPSECFDADGELAASVCEAGANSVGAVNGTGSRIVLQADASSTFEQTVIPEPATLTLFGLGLAGSAAARRRQMKKKNAQK
jgi:hypothetical protein